jgi:molybdopterin-guanine dinucleotide biosynthesis protein A
MDLCTDVSAVLLAGGRSGRMGKDKALLTVNGTPVVQLLASRLREITDEVLISTNDPSAY